MDQAICTLVDRQGCVMDTRIIIAERLKTMDDCGRNKQQLKMNILYIISQESNLESPKE